MIKSNEKSSLKFGLLAGLVLSLLLGGCATDDPEADAFFRRGWINPKKLDQPYEQPPPTDDAALRNYRG